MADDPTGWGDAALVAGNAEFRERDAQLLRAIQQTGSVSAAASQLQRSRARALRRIETLEDAFGTMVERHRGGDRGGGSELTPAGIAILERYDRLQAVLSSAATNPETVLSGQILAIDGELASVETAIGSIRGMHVGVEEDAEVHVHIGADALTIYRADGAPAATQTSARNRVHGHIVGIERGETIHVVAIDIDGTRMRALVTDESADRLALAEGIDVEVLWKATATLITKRA